MSVVTVASGGAGARDTIFGLTPAARLERQWRRLPARDKDGWTLVIGDDVVVDTPSLGWLTAQPGLVVVDPAGRPLLAWHAGETRAIEAWFATGTPPVRSLPSRSTADLEFFSGGLKKREAFLAFALTGADTRAIEDKLYFASFKGVTDLVTKYVWPRPALAVVRACVAFGITPNMVTIVSILLSIAAIPLFIGGHLFAGLACAWSMTFLDTVDGKLARTTVTYTDFGKYFDHVPDIVFPPLWWWSFMAGLAVADPENDTPRLWSCLGLILATYVVGRICEGVFGMRNGFGPFLWRRFDARFRLVLARRNPNLLILTAGTLLGQPDAAFLALGGWCIVSGLVQVAALAQSERARRRGPLRSFLEAPGEVRSSDPAIAPASL